LPSPTVTPRLEEETEAGEASCSALLGSPCSLGVGIAIAIGIDSSHGIQAFVPEAHACLDSDTDTEPDADWFAPNPWLAGAMKQNPFGVSRAKLPEMLLLFSYAEGVAYHSELAA